MTDTRQLAERFLTTLEARDWEPFGALLADDVVYELPQSRERIRGRDQYVQFNREYPGDWHLLPKVVIADETNAVAWFDWRVGDEPGEGIVFFGFAGDRISSVTDFWPEPYEPPAHRPSFVERW